MSSNFFILHTNINGLENKFDLLYEFLTGLDWSSTKTVVGIIPVTDLYIKK